MDGTRRSFDLEAIRADFPILSREVHGKPLVYLDSAASAQKPAQVLDALMSAYQDTYANVHRGLHFLSEASTDLYEAVRGKGAGVIGAASGDESVLPSGATMSLNLVARCWAQPRRQSGDEILISIAEHHANIVPWQMVAPPRPLTRQTTSRIGTTAPSPSLLSDFVCLAYKLIVLLFL